MGILQLLASRNYISVNKDLIKVLGLEEAIIMGELASEYNYWYEKQQLDDGYFYSTVENIEEHTTLSGHKQRKALKKLQEAGLIHIKVKGIPAKRYIKIFEEEVIKILNPQLLKNLTTRSEKNEKVEDENFNRNNNITNKNINNKNINKNRKNISNKVADDVPLSEIEEKILRNEFEELWIKYPKKRGKKEAFNNYCKYRKATNGDYVTKEEVEKGIDRYNRYITVNGIEEKYIKYGSTFFEEKAWEDDYTIESNKSSFVEWLELHQELA